jgi:molecular chaperone DnaK (HSP70)
VNYCIKEKTLNLDAKQMFRLRKACDEAKQQLSTRASYEIVIDALANGEDFELDITREQFE